MKKPFGNNKNKRPFAPSNRAFDGFRKPGKSRDEFDNDRPRTGPGRPAWKSQQSGEGRPGGAPPWKKNRPSGGGFAGGKPAWKKQRYERDDRGGRSDFGGPDSDRVERRPWQNDRPSYGHGPGSKPRKSYQQPSEFRNRGNSEPGANRPRKSFGGPKSYGAPKPYGSKPYGSGPARPERFQRQDREDYNARPERGDRYDRRERRFERQDRERSQGRPSDFRQERPSSGRYERSDDRRFQKRPYDKDFSQRDQVSVPSNKQNRPGDFRDSAKAERKAAPFVAPAHGDGPYAKPLVITLDDTNNVPTRIVWVYDSMVGELPEGEPAAGGTCYVYDEKSRFLGSAIFNPNSRIRARIFSFSRKIFNQEYIGEALVRAVGTRKRLGLLTESCRVIFGESDGLPGLIADKIGDYLVIQPLTFAVDRHLPFIIDRLNELVAPEGIVVRRDVAIRTKEGLEVGTPEIHGDIPEQVKIDEAGVTMFANITGGQKTGLFLDQRFNREVIKPWCTPEARVLDLFCHVGGWALRAAKYGAGEVIGVDSSRSSLDMAQAGAQASGFENVSFEEDDVFEYLRGLESGQLFDVIVCDPPAFAKTRAHYEEAFRAYLSLNYLVMKRLKPGGLLVTCSCSQAMSVTEFNEAVLTAARNARMQFQVLERRGAPADHPVLLGLPETEYLKCFVMHRSE